MATVSRTQSKTRATTPNDGRPILQFVAADGHSARAWLVDDGWRVEASSARLQERLHLALKQPVRVPRSHSEADGTRVLMGWEEVGPADPRYAAHWVLQLSHFGLDDVTVERAGVNPRSRRSS